MHPISWNEHILKINFNFKPASNKPLIVFDCSSRQFTKYSNNFKEKFGIKFYCFFFIKKQVVLDNRQSNTNTQRHIPTAIIIKFS